MMLMNTHIHEHLPLLLSLTRLEVSQVSNRQEQSVSKRFPNYNELMSVTFHGLSIAPLTI